MARPFRRPSRGPIGFAVRDMAGRGGAYEIDEDGAEALVFGSSSPLRVSAPGVLPAHFVVLPHDGVLVAASASSDAPAVLNGAPLPTSWTVLEVPSRVRIGGALVDFFYIHESGTVLIDLDIETTVADQGRDLVPSDLLGRTRLDPTGPHRRIATPPRPLLPPPRLPPRPHHMRAGVTAREVIMATLLYARFAWRSTSMSTRVLLGVVALLVIFVAAR